MKRRCEGFRKYRGVLVPEKPRGDRIFVRESIRWTAIRDGLMELSGMLPRSLYSFHTTLMELFAEAEVARAVCEAEERRAMGGNPGLFDGSGRAA